MLHFVLDAVAVCIGKLCCAFIFMCVLPVSYTAVFQVWVFLGPCGCLMLPQALVKNSIFIKKVVAVYTLGGMELSFIQAMVCIVPTILIKAVLFVHVGCSVGTVPFGLCIKI